MRDILSSNFIIGDDGQLSYDPMGWLKPRENNTSSFKLQNTISNPSESSQGLLSGFSNWFKNADNVDFSLDLLGKGLEGIIAWDKANKAYKLGKQSLQDNMNVNRAQFTANVANAFDKENFRNTSLEHFYAGSNPEALEQIKQNSQKYHQMIANAGQQIGINPNTFTNQYQQFNQLKA